MHGENIPYGYGFWSLVVFNAAFFVIFVLSFLTPLRRREWRSFGMYSAFIVALFTEMTAIHIVSNALLVPALLLAEEWWRRCPTASCNPWGSPARICEHQPREGSS